MIPRPPSVFYIASDAPTLTCPEDNGKNGVTASERQQQQPDLVRSVSAAAAAAVRARKRPSTVFRSSRGAPDFDSMVIREEEEEEEEEEVSLEEDSRKVSKRIQASGA